MVFRFSVPLTMLMCLMVSTGVAGEIDFNHDVRPILSDNCFACHGFDENSREAGLRLDSLEGATADLGGYAAIVPGKPEESELIVRVISDDSDLLMPPADSHKKRLDDRSVAILRQWISEGAVWGKHWAFQTPVKAATDQSGHPVDHFVRRRLAAERLSLAPRAAVHTLVRRLCFDLTGLPPTPELIADMGDNPTAQQWGDLVDQLIASPHFGERMAMWWLDGARYSDTDGYQQDGTRNNWPWRDWVVEAFDQNMPFDQFTIQQFAGDLLPEATAKQKLATCFHRNHMNNGEGGRDPEESRVDYVIDRVNTSGKLWLGLTLGCTQCHDHKFDPISQRDYYSLSAYFNSIDETGQAGGNARPYLKYKSPHAARAVDESNELLKRSQAALEKIRKSAGEQAERWIDVQIARVADGFMPWTVVKPLRMATKEGYVLRLASDIPDAASTGPEDSDLADRVASSSPHPRITRKTILSSPRRRRRWSESPAFGLMCTRMRHTRPESTRMGRAASSF